MTQLLGLMPLLYLFYLYLSLPLGVYLLQRWRLAHSGGMTDPALGQKVVGHFFQAVSLPIFLAGLSLLLASIFQGDSDDLLRVGAGLAASGLISLAVHSLLLWRKFPGGEDFQVARIFMAFNLIVVGLIALFLLTAGAVMFFQSDKKGLEIFLAGLIMFGLAWVWLGYRFFGAVPRKACPAHASKDSGGEGA